MSRSKDGPRDAERLRGAHYSPRPVVDFLVSRMLVTLLRQRRWVATGPWPRVCDPACGAGVFLESALEALCGWVRRQVGPDLKPGWLAERLVGALFGVDVDPTAVQDARAALLDCARRWDPACEALDLSRNIVVGNSLISGPDTPKRWRPVRFREVFAQGPEPGRFDLVVGNPPYVDSEEMTRSAPELRRYLTEHYDTASGNWDLFCPFIERAVQLLGVDGRLGLIVPNKLLSARYAVKTRRLLATLDLELLRDYSRVRLFDAAVYPLVLIARRRPRRLPALRVEVATGRLNAVRIESSRTVTRAKLVRTADAGWSEHLASGPLAVVGPSLRPLGEIAVVCGAASVSEAYALAPLVRECDHDHGHDHGCHRLVNTGTLDPHRHLWGRRRLRYLGATYERPCVSAGALVEEFPRRAAQARSAKIIVAGLARRLECVLDEGELLAGKSTSLILATAGKGDGEGPLDLALFVGLLNSAAASQMLQRQFGGLALSGGYLRIGPPQLRALCIPDPAAIEPAGLREQLCGAVRELGRLADRGEPADTEGWLAQQRRLDEPSWALFGLERPLDT